MGGIGGEKGGYRTLYEMRAKLVEKLYKNKIKD
jgi:hypothetical protein